MRKTLKQILTLILILTTVLLAAEKSVTAYVDPFIGTGGHGHTFPGATLPFGMVQLSPDTRQDDTWDGCGGYYYDDESILGFSHTHLSGTGVSDYGDILFLPFTGEISLDPGKRGEPDSGYRSRYSHDNESAEPGYYQVYLDDYDVNVELTATLRTGLHKYTFPKGKKAGVFIDLKHRDPVLNSAIYPVGKNAIAGFRRSKLWAGDQRLYFYAEFSQDFNAYELFSNNEKVDVDSISSENVKAKLYFDNKKPLLVRLGISAVSIEGAKQNLLAENQTWDFAKVRQDAKEIWEKSLGKIEVIDDNETNKEIFYSALYHSLLTPNLYEDVDGKYRGMDGRVHEAKNFDNYTVFSLWDTFRGLHPLLTILEPKLTNDLVHTLINKQQQYGEIPMWELAANDTRCMIGYHGVSLIADAYAKGIRDYNLNRALRAMYTSALVDKRGINYYKELGFVPTNRNSQSVSKTLEYAYDDWCIAQFAKEIGNDNVYNRFIRRSRFFENVFDPSTNFMRPKYDDRQWLKDFEPAAVNYNFNFTEGNSYQYSLFVPHDLQTLIEMTGGEANFDKWLDNLFYGSTLEMEEESDVSGLIGQYAHGNEPSHHLAYLYNYCGEAWKSEKIIARVRKEMYDETPAGLSGNEDCGQMSAWYVLSALGFYSVCPGVPEYVIGTPLFDKVIIHNDNGNDFTINAKNVSPSNIYIQSASLNGSNYDKSVVYHQDIVDGGELIFNMSNKPNKNFAKDHRPYSDDQKIVSIPFHKSESEVFFGEAEVEFGCDTKDAKIYYSTDGELPDENSTLYTKPIKINKHTMFRVRAYKDGYEPSYSITVNFRPATGMKLKSDDVQSGLEYIYYEGIFRSVYDYVGVKPAKSGIANQINLKPRDRDEWIGFEHKGLIKILADGKYSFTVSANDGCQLLIDGQELFESDGRKSEAFAMTKAINLGAGYHNISVKSFQCSDRIFLKAWWEGPGFEREEIPAEVLFHLKEGKKRD